MSVSYSKQLCEQIGKLRKRSGMTQDQLAARLGVSYQAVSKWENGQSCPDIASLPLIAEMFRVSIDELFGRRMSIGLYEGLVAEYLFQGDARDSSGGEHHGTVVGASLCTDRFGHPDSAYCFDGKDDYILVEAAPKLNGESFSLSVWCCYDRDARLEGWTHAIVSQDGHFQNRVYQLSTYEGSITFHRFVHDKDLYVQSTVQKEFWYHIGVVYDNQVFRLYKNGMLVGETHGKLTPSHKEPLFIGCKSTFEPYFFFKGKIDDVRIYDRALTEDEVQALYVENGWKPIEEPETPVIDAGDVPLLESVANVQLQLPREDIKAAAEWYIQHLGFKLHMEYQQQFYMLSLFKGPNLYLHSSLSESTRQETFAPFVYSTKRPVEQLEKHLIEAGSRHVTVKDEGFAHFVCFQDPFGKSWVIKRDKR
ncbi:LamG-like jellyroll fold domain-containing protein [Paenibacillus ginsengarvi]|uniref:LamG-like jellyroll fold domain-containing protein n=1 Tax=Paenibacillus ginsengarvi TaxID=400777 RepID=UPI00131595AF|nr:LamG-like jellyroll fold domain-containing protein [Paenibacillus ginsengarvi]